MTCAWILTKELFLKTEPVSPSRASDVEPVPQGSKMVVDFLSNLLLDSILSITFLIFEDLRLELAPSVVDVGARDTSRARGHEMTGTGTKGRDFPMILGHEDVLRQ